MDRDDVSFLNSEYVSKNGARETYCYVFTYLEHIEA